MRSDMETDFPRIDSTPGSVPIDRVRRSVMTHSLIQRFLYDVVMFSSKWEEVCSKSPLPSITFQQLGAVKGEPPQAKCYSSLLVFEVTLSCDAEAAACGFCGRFRLGLTFQLRMFHHHWNHSSVWEIRQACREERTSEWARWVTEQLCVCICLYMQHSNLLLEHPIRNEWEKCP